MTSQKKELLWLLTENNLSNTMTGFYDAITGLGENSKILQTDNPWDTDPSEYKGSKFTKEGMSMICGFLELIKNFAKDETTFRKQFLEPFQIIAKMLEEFKNTGNSKRSTDLEGWIFSISRPTTIAGQQRITVSSVIPKLQTAMSVSVSKESIKKTSSKYFKFTKCQPIGLVNRIHPVNGFEISKTDKDVLLSKFNFLFTSFNDIKLLGTSIEMENFCEIESYQSEVKQHMGFSFVSFAKVVDVQGRLLSLQGLDEQTIVSFTIPDHYYENAKMNDPKKLIGKYVRFFGVKWYNPNLKNAIDLNTSEIFLMQEEEDLDRLRLEETIGMIRLRTKMPQLEIKKYLSKEIEVNDCIEVKNNFAHFRYLQSDDPICKKFIEAMLTIKNLRVEYKISLPRVTQEQLIDPKKLDKYFRVEIVKKSRILYEILVDYQMQIDLYGEYNRQLTISKLTSVTYSEEIVIRKIWHLKYLGIFEFLKKDEKITGIGKKVLEDCIEAELDKSQFNSKSIIEIGEIQNFGIPPSIFLKYLQDGNLTGFCPVMLDGQKTKIFWATEGKITSVYETKIIEYQNKRNAILDLMRSVAHSVTPQWISEKLADKGKKMSVFIVNLLLSEIEETGRIKPDGDSWKYTIRARVYDLFQVFPDKRFNLDTIHRELVIPKREEDEEEMEECLQDFETKKIIFSINGEWESTKDIDKKIIIIANEKIRESVMRILDEACDVSKNNLVKDRYMTGISTQGVDLDIVVDQVKNIFSKIGFLELIEKHGIEPKQVIEDEINMMVADKTIIKIDGMLSKKD